VLTQIFGAFLLVTSVQMVATAWRKKPQPQPAAK
jgi:hypothetical protein